MSTPAMVPVISADGSQRGQVSSDEFPAAQQAGWRLGVPVVNDQGQKGLVASDEFKSAQAAGWKQPNTDELSTWQAFKNTLPGASDFLHAVGMPANSSEFNQMAQTAGQKTLGQTLKQGPPGGWGTAVLGPGAPILGSMGKELYRAVSNPRDPMSAVHAAAGLNPFAAPVIDQMSQQGLGTPQANATGVLGAGALAAGEALPKVSGMIPTKAGAGELFNQASAAAGGSAIDLTAPGNTALAIRQAASSGGRMPKVVRDFISRTTDPSQGPLTYDEARQFYQNAGALSVNERNGLSPSMQRMLGQFRSDLGNSIQGAASGAGVGQQYAGAMQQYRQASAMENFIDMLKSATVSGVKKAASGAAWGSGVAGPGYAIYKAITGQGNK